MMDKWKERLRRWGPRLGYPLFYLFCLIVFLPWTFPFERLRDRIVTTFNASQRSSSQPQELQIDEMDSSFLTGVKAKGVRLLSPSADASKPPTVLTIDEARARISLLGLLVGSKDVSFRLDAFGGVIKGSFEDSGKNREIDVAFEDVDLGSIPSIAASIGFPLAGKLVGTLKLALPEGKAAKANGNLALDVKDMAAGTEKELTVKTPMGPFTLPRLKVGQLTINGEAKDGQLKLSKVSSSGGDVDLNGEGKVQLRDNAADAHLDANLKFRINEGYKNKSDTTKLLFGSGPTGKDKPMMDLDPRMSRAKTADGFYALRVAGTLAKPDVQPGSGR
jgi:type II secretion system protein N